MKKMKPILFSAPMVIAILDGRKTQTRRVIKAPVLRNVREPDEVLFDGKICKFNWHGDDVIGGFEIKPPYQPGDILWVQETWKVIRLLENMQMQFEYRADGLISKTIDFLLDRFTKFKKFANKHGWQSPYFMPREAARISLKVKGVRVERVQDITTEDICNEGIWVEPPPIVKNGAQLPSDFEKRTEVQKDEWFKTTARATYIGQCEHIAALHREWEKLWDNLNAKRGYGWETNPWVWVYEFERVDKPGEECRKTLQNGAIIP